MQFIKTFVFKGLGKSPFLARIDDAIKHCPLQQCPHETKPKLWDVHTGQEKATLKGHTHFVSAVALSDDGMLLASGSQDQTIKLWDVKTGQEKATLKGHTGAPNGVAFSGDGSLLASAGGFEKAVRLWDIPTSKKPDE